MSTDLSLSLSASPKDGQKLKNAGLGCRPPARPRPPAHAAAPQRAAKAQVQVPEKYARAGSQWRSAVTTFPAPLHSNGENGRVRVVPVQQKRLTPAAAAAARRDE